MLTNIANDLDLLLTDLCHMQPYGPGDAAVGEQTPGGREQTLHTLTRHSGDTLGRDSFLSSAEAASRRLGDTTGSVVVVVNGSVLVVVVVCPPLKPSTDVHAGSETAEGSC